MAKWSSQINLLHLRSEIKAIEDWILILASIELDRLYLVPRSFVALLSLIHKIKAFGFLFQLVSNAPLGNIHLNVCDNDVR